MADFTPYETPAREAQYLPVMHPGRPVGRDEILKQIYAHLKNNQSVLRVTLSAASADPVAMKDPATNDKTNTPIRIPNEILLLMSPSFLLWAAVPG